MKAMIVEPGYNDYLAEQAVFAGMPVEIVPIPESASDAQRADMLKDADVVIIRDRPLGADLIHCMHKVKGIVRYGTGYDNVDIACATEKRIPVANVTDYGADESVSEFAVALMLAASRQIVRRDKAVRSGGWNIGQKEPMFQLKGRTLGVLSFGRIARSFVKKVRGLGFADILVADPYVAQEVFTAHQVTPVDIDTLCRLSDVISLHAPLTHETKHIINAARLKTMNPNTVIINTGRGGLINEADLYQALKSKQIYAAGIDVYGIEPARADHPFFELDNCIVTDHTAWYTAEACINLQTNAAKEAKRLLQGEMPINWVNRW